MNEVYWMAKERAEERMPLCLELELPPEPERPEPKPEPTRGCVVVDLTVDLSVDPEIPF